MTKTKKKPTLKRRDQPGLMVHVPLNVYNASKKFMSNREITEESFVKKCVDMAIMDNADFTETNDKEKDSLHFRTDPQFINEVDKQAKRFGLNRSEYVRKVVEYVLKKQGELNN